MTTLTVRRVHVPFRVVAPVVVVAWLAAWFANQPLANWAAYDLLGFERGSHLGDAIAFFFLDVPKVLLLLLGIMTVVSFLRSYFPPERMRAALAGRGTVPATSGRPRSGLSRRSARAPRCRSSSASWRPGSRLASPSRS